ncbi:alpha-amylase family glycosyl hydrolase [Patescibacteria group bacterium]|nr:alpha-amylase family glycosyl hydrolase [Patescibacteria group bacterium]
MPISLEMRDGNQPHMIPDHENLFSIPTQLVDLYPYKLGRMEKTLLRRMLVLENKKASTGFGDQFRLFDGSDTARDIVDCSIDIGSKDEPLAIMVGLSYLDKGRFDRCELGVLLGFNNQNSSKNFIPNKPLINTKAWSICLKMVNGIVDCRTTCQAARAKRDNKAYVFPESGQILFLLNKSLLRSTGWKDSNPLTLQLYTSYPEGEFLTDTLDTRKKKKADAESFIKAREVGQPFNAHLLNFYDTKSRKILSPDGKEIIVDEGQYPEIIYYVMIDRFHRDTEREDGTLFSLSNPYTFHGGNFLGIKEKLDYIKSLGITTLCLSPPMENIEKFTFPDGKTIYSYHGYWVKNHQEVDPRFGTMEQFRELVRQVHARGMRIILDFPINGLGYGHRWEEERPDWFKKGEPLHSTVDIGPYELVTRPLFGLPSFNHAKKEVADYLIGTVSDWVRKTGIDGFRIDAALHINPLFLQKLMTKLADDFDRNIQLIGEFATHDEKRLAAYQEFGPMGVLDYPLYYKLIKALNGGNMKDVANSLGSELFYEPSLRYLFLDNQDTTRIRNILGNNLWKNGMAFTLLFTALPLPVVYYGSENALEGTVTPFSDSEVRKDMLFTSLDKGFTRFFTYLTFLRRNHPVLTRGIIDITCRDDTVLSYMRRHPGLEEEFLVLINTSEIGQNRQLFIKSRYPKNSLWYDLYSSDEFRSDTNGRIGIDLNPYQTRLLVPKRFVVRGNITPLN